MGLQDSAGVQVPCANSFNTRFTYVSRQSSSYRMVQILVSFTITIILVVFLNELA